MTDLRKSMDFYHDRVYLLELRKIAIPIIIQQFMFSGLNMLGVIFVGQRGDVAVAAVGLAGQIAFILNLVHFGIISGAAMFTAQFWGRKDIPNLRRVLGLCLMMALSASLIFFFLSQFLPAQLLGIYSKDQAVIDLGAHYLRVFSWTFLFFAVTFSYSLVMRSTGDVKTPTVISVGALTISTFLSYALIFGKFGFPELGIQGAAVAAVIARALECVTLLIAAYKLKSPVAASMRELTSFDLGFLGKVIKPMLPVILNELFWSLGITTYNVIYARIGTTSFAAMNIVSTIEQMAFVVFFGVSNATSVLVGNNIGGGQEEKAHLYAGYSLYIAALGGILIGIAIHFAKSPVLSLYKVSPDVIQYASNILTIMSLFIWMRVSNMTIVVGILRAGGDTRYSLFLDGIIIWIVGVPMAYFAAFILDLPIYFVYLFVMSEETAKYILGIIRYRSRKWINNLVAQVEAVI
jgi:putative MATE family efflux protein